MTTDTTPNQPNGRVPGQAATTTDCGTQARPVITCMAATTDRDRRRVRRHQPPAAHHRPVVGCPRPAKHIVDRRFAP